MQVIKIGDRRYLVDDQGFLKEFAHWEKEFAVHCGRKAKQRISQLTDKHWDLIDGLRAYFLESGRLPLVRHFCSEMQVKQRVLYELFPGGPYFGIAKIAGIPQQPIDPNH